MSRLNIPKFHVNEPSIDKRNDLVRHFFAILIPRNPILIGASSIMPKGAVDEEDGQKHYVKVGNEMSKKRRKRPENSASNFRNIMKMPR